MPSVLPGSYKLVPFRAAVVDGSMYVDKIKSAELDFVRAVRKICPQAVISSSFDMHATISEALVSSLDALSAFRTAPHVDTFETGRRASDYALRILGGKKYYKALYHAPVLIAGEKSESSNEPMKSICRYIEEKESGNLMLSLLLGFPWADREDAGVTAFALASTKEEAEKEAEKLISLFIFRLKEFEFCADALAEDEAIKRAGEAVEKKVFPVVLSESGDNPTAGSTQDVTIFLEKILSDKILSTLSPPLLYQGILDPAAVDAFIEKQIGTVLEISLGAAFDEKTSKPLKVRAELKAKVRGYGRENTLDAVLLFIDGVDVVVTSKKTGCYDVHLMSALSCNPEKRKVICVKLGYLEPDLKKISRKSILVLSRGSTNEILESLDYKNIPRPFYPLDEFDLVPKKLY
ncbi:MAG TPA: M81 family metallopeptidase [Candidatus Ornithospirochaeta avicola]|uniref:M81 family metallopeptidase n=1 Tax=Candidatus Ornithospirochaeta avicola TaxID=2840896 RepID=A0A9D1TM68_9SPIO|nr:M81 family metallopeptidase [Candidatus Ornithospirochaeta avicola]